MVESISFSKKISMNVVFIYSLGFFAGSRPKGREKGAMVKGGVFYP
jgi:hypothetical protein